MRWRRIAGLFGALMLTLGSAGVAAYRASTGGWRTVSYRGATFEVPAGWPVYDLSIDRHRCVLLNRHAVYLGTQGPNPRCPARALGRTEALQLAPVEDSSSLSNALGATYPDLGVAATVSYFRDRSLASRILASAASSPGRATGMSRVSPRHSTAQLLDAPMAAGPTTQSGPGFDTCGAPSLDAMNAWRYHSPYLTMTIYIGGANRACGDGNLSSSWVTSAVQSGWTLVPTYVGLQAPCVQQPDLAMIDGPQAVAEGTAAADDAASRAANFGLSPGNPIYFDMEGYGNDPDCIQTVQTFVSAWVKELHAKGYVAGVYGSSASTIANEAAIYNDIVLAHPDDVWIANWSGNPNIYGDPYFPDADWPPHHRLHQWAPGHDETYGGYTITIDSDVTDGDVTGSASSSAPAPPPTPAPTTTTAAPAPTTTTTAPAPTTTTTAPTTTTTAPPATTTTTAPPTTTTTAPTTTSTTAPAPPTTTSTTAPAR